MSHDADKVIFNISNHILSEHKKLILSKGLNFAVPPENSNYADFLLPFELLHRDTNSLGGINFDKNFIKSRLRNCAFS